MCVCVCVRIREGEREKKRKTVSNTHNFAYGLYFFVDVRSFTEIHLLPFPAGKKKRNSCFCRCHLFAFVWQKRMSEWN